MENARTMHTRPNDNTLNFIFSHFFFLPHRVALTLSHFHSPAPTPSHSCPSHPYLIPPLSFSPVRLPFMYIVYSKSWKSWKSANRCHKMKLMWFARDVRSPICFFPFFFCHFDPVFSSSSSSVFPETLVHSLRTQQHSHTHIRYKFRIVPISHHVPCFHCMRQENCLLRIFKSKLLID